MGEELGESRKLWDQGCGSCVRDRIADAQQVSGLTAEHYHIVGGAQRRWEVQYAC